MCLFLSLSFSFSLKSIREVATLQRSGRAKSQLSSVIFPILRSPRLVCLPRAAGDPVPPGTCYSLTTRRCSKGICPRRGYPTNSLHARSLPSLCRRITTASFYAYVISPSKCAPGKLRLVKRAVTSTRCIRR